MIGRSWLGAHVSFDVCLRGADRSGLAPTKLLRESRKHRRTDRKEE